jgi:hypothetical protein
MEDHYEWFRRDGESRHGDVSQRISEILESQGFASSEKFIQDVIRACETYHHRMRMETLKSKAPSEMKKLQSYLRRLSYDTRLELAAPLNAFEEELTRTTDEISRGRGRPETWAKDTFIDELT